MSDNTVQTNEGPLPSSTDGTPIEVTNTNPDGIDVGTNAIELGNDPVPALTTDNDLPASAVVRNVPSRKTVSPFTVTAPGVERRVIEGDTITDYMPGNTTGDVPTEQADGENANVGDNPTGESEGFPPAATETVVADPASTGEEYTQTTETPANDFQGVTPEVLPEGETELKKPRRFSRT